MKAFNFDIYICCPTTGVPGWNIIYVDVFADDIKQAREILKTVPNYDCEVIFNYKIDLDEVQTEAHAKGEKYLVWVDRRD